jgi:hypothetical protein
LREIESYVDEKREKEKLKKKSWIESFEWDFLKKIFCDYLSTNLEGM